MSQITANMDRVTYAKHNKLISEIVDHLLEAPEAEYDVPDLARLFDLADSTLKKNVPEINIRLLQRRTGLRLASSDNGRTWSLIPR